MKREYIRENFELGLILLLGLFLRCVRLTAVSLWFDEIFTVYRSNHDLDRVMASLVGSPFPPLYYLMMNGWLNLTGLSEAALRFPSVLFSVGSIFAVYLLARELFDKKTGLWAAFFVAISPCSIDFAQNAKMYAMIWCLTTFSLYFLLRFVKTGSRKDLAAYFIVSVLSLYTMYLALLVWIFQNLLFFFIADRKLRKPWIVCQLGLAAAFAPWLSHFFSYAADPVYSLWIIPHKSSLLTYLFATFGWMIGNNLDLFPKWLFVSLNLFAGLLLAGTFLEKGPLRRKAGILWFYVLFILLFFVASDFTHRPLVVERYLAILHVPVLILIAFGTNRFSPRLRPALMFLFILISLSSLYLGYWQKGLKTSREDWRELFIDLGRQAGDGQVVWVSPYTEVLYDVSEYYSGKKFIFMNAADFRKNPSVPENIFVISSHGQEPKNLSPQSLIKKTAYAGNLSLSEYHLEP